MGTVIDAICTPFQHEFMIRALVVSLLVGIMCPVIGSYVVTRRLAFMGDALSHAIMPGLGGGFLIGISPFAGAIPVGVAVALLVGFLSRRTGVSEDTMIGILFAGMFALGLTMLTMAKGMPVELEDILLGQVLAVSTVDLYVTLGLAVGVVSVLTLLHKELVFTSFDPIGATVGGIPTGALDYTLLILLAIVIVLAVQAVGVVLVMAMLVTPAATAYLMVRGFVPLMAVSALLGIVSAIAGLYLSFYYNLPSGPAMTLVSTAIFLPVAVIFRKTL